LPGAAVACFLALLIAGLVIRNDSWIYTQIGWLDPWAYVGFGYDYGHPRFDADNYKLGRLPWILAEFYTRHVFDPVASQYFLQLSSLLIQGWFFYLALDRLLGMVPGVIGAAFLITLPFIHGSGGADYNDTPSGMLYALSFYVLTVAAPSSRPVWPVLFGICLGLLLHTNFLYVNLLVPLLMHFASLRWHESELMQPRSILAFCALALLGAFAVTVALCFVNWSYGREWLFFATFAKMATGYLLDSSSQKLWWQPWSNEWYRHAVYVGVLAAGVVTAATLVLLACFKRGNPATRFQIVNLTVQYMSVCAIWIFWQTIGQTAFQPYYYAYPLFVPLACVVSSIVAFSARPEPRINIVVLAAIIAFASVMPYSSHWPIKASIQTSYESLSLFLAIFAVGLLLISLSARLGICVFALLLGPANAWVNQDDVHYRRAPCTDRRDAQLALIAAHNAVASIDPGFSRDVYVWRHPDGDNAISVSTCSLVPERFIDDSLSWSGWHYLDDARPFKQQISEISAERLRDVIHLDPIIVIVTESSQITEQLRQRFANLGRQFDSTKQIRINQGEVRFSLQILK
jgi:hypothetical protein